MALPPQPPLPDNSPLFWIDDDDGYQLYVTSDALTARSPIKPTTRYVKINQKNWDESGQMLATKALIAEGGIELSVDDDNATLSIDIEALTDRVAELIVDQESQPAIGGVGWDGEIIPVNVPPPVQVPRPPYVSRKGGSVNIDPTKSSTWLIEAVGALHLRFISIPFIDQAIKILVRVTSDDPVPISVTYENVLAPEGQELPTEFARGTTHEFIVTADTEDGYAFHTQLRGASAPPQQPQQPQGAIAKVIHGYKPIKFANRFQSDPDGSVLFASATDGRDSLQDPKVSSLPTGLLLNDPEFGLNNSRIYLLQVADNNDRDVVGVGPMASQSLAWIKVPGEDISTLTKVSGSSATPKIPEHDGEGLQVSIYSDSAESSTVEFDGVETLASNMLVPTQNRWRGIHIVSRSDKGPVLEGTVSESTDWSILTMVVR